MIRVPVSYRYVSCHAVTQQLSIQRETDSGRDANKKPTIDGRQVSVRPVVNDKDTQFIVCFSGKGNNSQASTSPKPDGPVRQLSVTRLPFPPVQWKPFGRQISGVSHGLRPMGEQQVFSYRHLAS